MRATREQEGRLEPGTRQRPADASGNERLNPQGESKQARKLGETGTPQLSPRPSCALNRSLGGLHPHSHPQIPPDPQATPRAGPSKIIAPTESQEPSTVTSLPPQRLTPLGPGASLSSPPSPKASSRIRPGTGAPRPGLGPAPLCAGPSLSSTS